MNERSRKRAHIVRWASLSASLCCLVLTILWMRAPGWMPTLFRSTPITLGATAHWQSFGGSWEIMSDYIRDDSDERGSKLIIGSPKWGDYSIESNIALRSVTGYASDAGFLLRTSHEEEGVYAYYGYYALLHTVRDGRAEFILGRVGQGPSNLAEVTLPNGLGTQAWYHLKFVAVGCRFVAVVQALSSPHEPQTLQATDPDCIIHGRAGLASSHAGGEWRDVSITPATSRDLDLVLKDAASSPIQQRALPAPPPASNLSRTRSASLSPDPEQTTPISNAVLYALIAPQTLTITGQVNLLHPEIVIQDSSGGIPIHPASPSSLKLGDEVTVTGEANSQGGMAAIDHASVHVLWEGSPVPAISVTPSQLATASYDGRYIESEGILAGRQRISSDLVALDFIAGPQRLQGIVPQGRERDPASGIQIGSSVRFHGVATRDARYLVDGIAFGVLLRSADDLQVTAGPPWWTARHLLLLSCLLTMIVVAIGLLYRHVERAKLLAVTQEREHLAYEMHDTLAQSVAGIGFQLEAIRATLPEGERGLRQQLALAQDLVRHSHAEARTSITMLRPHEVQQHGLLSGLADCALKLIGSSGVAVETEIRGTPRSVSMKINDALFRIGQEAIANAIRHANPTKLHMVLDTQERRLILSIKDNGKGYAREGESQTLGLLSMQKRAEIIGAEFSIKGLEGEGTTVSITVPLPRYSSVFNLRRVLHTD